MNSQTKEPKAPLLRLSDALGDFLENAAIAHTARTTGVPPGPITGIAALDRGIGWSFATGLHGVTGNAGAGKTAFTCQVAAHCHFPALYVTCEMAPAELLRRHTARETQTFLGKFRSGELSPQTAEALALQAIAKIPALALLDATRAPASPTHIRDCARAIRGEAKSMLIVIDSLQSWVESLDLGQEYEALNAGIKSLRALAFELDVPILFISERNRDSMKSGGLNAGAGTRKIEYGAETVLDLERDMGVGYDGAGEVEVKVRISKNRHGDVGTEFPLRFNGAFQTFRGLEATEVAEQAVPKASPKGRKL